jgi:hypothetical protein
MAQFTTGRPKTGGRRKGTGNRVSGALKDMVLQALSNKGGVYLERQAEKTPWHFLRYSVAFSHSK